MFGVLRTRRPPGGPLAFVLGDMDLLRPLGLAGIRCAVIAPENSWLAHSRYTERLLPFTIDENREDEWVEALVTLGLREAQPPVLFFQADTHLLLVSRHRRRLEKAFRFALPEADFIEQLVDKARFQRLSEARGASGAAHAHAPSHTQLAAARPGSALSLDRQTPDSSRVLGHD